MSNTSTILIIETVHYTGQSRIDGASQSNSYLIVETSGDLEEIDFESMHSISNPASPLNASSTLVYPSSKLIRSGARSLKKPKPKTKITKVHQGSDGSTPHHEHRLRDTQYSSKYSPVPGCICHGTVVACLTADTRSPRPWYNVVVIGKVWGRSQIRTIKIFRSCQGCRGFNH